MVIAYLGYTALGQEDHTRIRIFVYAGFLDSLLLFLSALSDAGEIYGSKRDNESLCAQTGHFRFSEAVRVRRHECSYGTYYLTAMLTFAAATTLALSAFYARGLERRAAKFNK